MHDVPASSSAAASRPAGDRPTGRPGDTSDRLADERALLAEVLEAEAGAVGAIAERLRRDERTAETWRRALDVLDVPDAHVVVSGMGKSGLIGAKISATLSSLGRPSSVVHPAEAVHGDLGRIRRGDAVMLLSFSGSTEEVVNLAAILRADGVSTLGISGRADSDLARLSTVHLDLGNLAEACPLRLAPTASTTATLAVGDALALALARRRNFDHSDFRQRHPGGLLGVGLRPITEALRFRVGENLPLVPETVTVGEALERSATDRRTGAIVLIDDAGRLAGIFTDADLRRLVRARGAGGLAAPIRDVMTTHPVRLTTDDLVRDAVAIVRERRLDEIPVVNGDGAPVGLVDVQDLISMKVVRD